MQEEMREHLRRAAARLQDRGMSDADAQAAAQREFGNLGITQEAARDIRGIRWVEHGVADLRYALRQYRKSPLTTAAILLVLAGGTGLNAFLFTVVRSFETQPAPGISSDPSRVRVRSLVQDASSGHWFGRGFLPALVPQLSNMPGVFRAIAGSAPEPVVLGAGRSDPVTGTALWITPHYFAVLGVHPQLGSWSAIDADSTGEFVAVISHELWHDQFGGRLDVIGRPVVIDARTFTVIGVAPARFAGADPIDTKSLVWLPLSARPGVTGAGSSDSLRLSLVAILHRRGDMLRANLAVRAILNRHPLAPPTGPRWQATSADVVPLLSGNGDPDDGRRPMFVALGGVGVLILLVVCITVSALLAGLGVVRRREIAVRIALGASRPRIVRQLLTESVGLALMGSVIGCAALLAALRIGAERVFPFELAPPWLTFAFALTCAVMCGLLFGLSPALHATRLTVSDVLKATSGTVATARLALQRRLVVIQIALTQPLLIGLAALIALLLGNVAEDNSAAISAKIVVVTLAPPAGMTPAQVASQLDNVVTSLMALPAVVAAVPHSDGYLLSEVIPLDAGAAGSGRSFVAHGHYAAPGYLSLMGIPLQQGRDFRSGDVDAVIIGSDLARQVWGSANPLGQTLQQMRNGQRADRPLTVIGVFNPGATGSTREGGAARFYIPIGLRQGGVAVYSGYGAGDNAILVRTRGPAEPLLQDLRRRIQRQVPSIPLGPVTTLASLQADSRHRSLQVAALGAVSGVLTLLLASLGVYAVVALALSQRLKEIGVRMALGAQSWQTTGLFFKKGMQLGASGVVCGLPLSALVLHYLNVPVSVSVPVLSAITAVVALGVTALATWLPARQAGRVDPIVVLRAE
jgi:putative ABC transport system permease protein